MNASNGTSQSARDNPPPVIYANLGKCKFSRFQHVSSKSAFRKNLFWLFGEAKSEIQIRPANVRHPENPTEIEIRVDAISKLRFAEIEYGERNRCL